MHFHWWSMFKSLDVNSILKRMKVAINAVSDKQLADYLGIHPTTIHAWKKRGAIGNWEVIFEKFKDKDLNWIIYGEEEEYNPQGGEVLEQILNLQPQATFSFLRTNEPKKKYPDYEQQLKDIVKKLTFIDQYRLFKIAKVLLEIEEETQ